LLLDNVPNSLLCDIDFLLLLLGLSGLSGLGLFRDTAIFHIVLLRLLSSIARIGPRGDLGIVHPNSQHDLGAEDEHRNPQFPAILPIRALEVLPHIRIPQRLDAPGFGLFGRILCARHFRNYSL